MLLPIHAHTRGLRYQDAEYLALLRSLRRGSVLLKPALLAFSGTGRAALAGAARQLAKDLERPLLRVDLAQVVGKYIGETEKNLSQLLARAEASGAVLLFDEADALFGRRSGVKDSHDRYANQEVSYLLARLENYRGVVLLLSTSSLNSSLLQGRLRPVTVRFPPA